MEKNRVKNRNDYLEQRVKTPSSHHSSGSNLSNEMNQYMLDLSHQTAAARQLEQREHLMNNRISKLRRDNEKAQQQIKV